MTPGQLRAARKLLGWSRYRLAAMSGIPPGTVVRVEQGLAPRSVTPERVTAIRVALEAAGIEFTGGGGPEARLRTAERRP